MGEAEALQGELAAAREQQSAVGELLGLISRSGYDLQALLDAVIERATKLCRARQGFIYRMDPDGRYRLWSSYGITPDFARFTDENPVHPAHRGTLTGRVAIEKRVVHIPDVLEDKEYTYWEAQRVGGFRAMLGVPLLHEGVAIGVIVMWRTEPDPFSAGEIELVKTFADQAVIAIGNARLLSQTKAALERQTATSELLQVISRSAFELQPVLEKAIEAAVRLCGADVAWMVLAEGEIFRNVVRYASTPELRHVFDSAVSLDIVLRSPTGLLGKALIERRTVHAPDVLADPELLAASRMVRETGSPSALAVPMLRANKLVAAIVLARLEQRPFAHSAIELVETFADHVVLSIEDVRLFY